MGEIFQKIEITYQLTVIFYILIALNEVGLQKFKQDDYFQRCIVLFEVTLHSLFRK